MNYGLTRFFTITATAIAVMLSMPRHTTAQNLAWDTSFIAENTFFVGALNVEALLRLEPEDSELRKSLAEIILREAGMKLDDLRQIQFVMAGEKVESEEDTFEVKFLFNTDQDFDYVFDKMFRGDRHEEAEHQGKKYYKSKSTRQPSLYMPDKQTMIVANQVRLLELFDSEGGKGKIVDRLADADGNAHAYVAFEYNDQLDEFVEEIAEEIRDLPFDMHDIAAEATRGELIVMLDADQPLVANLEAKNADGAERLQRAIEALVALGKVGIPMARAQMEKVPDFGDPEQKAKMEEMMESASKGLDTAQALLDGTEVKTQGNQLTMKTKVMGGAADGMRALIQTLFMGVAVRMEAAPPAAIDRAIEVDVIGEAKE